MTDMASRRFVLVASPSATEWIGEVLRRIFPCPDDLPRPIRRLVERLGEGDRNAG